jgi:hypothetical protein
MSTFWRKTGLLIGLTLAALPTGCGRDPRDAPAGQPLAQPSTPRQSPGRGGVQATAGANPKEDHPMQETPSPTPQPAGRSEPIVAQPVRIQPGLFKTVRATDGTFSMKVPSDWTVQSATLEGLRLRSPKGEAIFQYPEQVMANQQTFQFQLLGEQFRRQQAGQMPLSREEVEARTRRVAPPRSPVDVVEVYWPRANAPFVQNLRVLETHELPPEAKRFWEAKGSKGALVHYQYTLRPKQGSKSQREQLPPALAGQDEVAMEGEASVLTHPPLGMFWIYQTCGVEAPAEVFRKNRVLYDVIEHSRKDNPEVIDEVVKAKNAAIASMGRAFLQAGDEWQRSSTAISEYWRYVLGDRVPYYSERENRIYTIAPEQQQRLGAGAVVGPGGEILRPAAVEDIKRTLPSLVPND